MYFDVEINIPEQDRNMFSRLELFNRSNNQHTVPDRYNESLGKSGPVLSASLFPTALWYPDS